MECFILDLADASHSLGTQVKGVEISGEIRERVPSSWFSGEPESLLHGHHIAHDSMEVTLSIW